MRRTSVRALVIGLLACAVASAAWGHGTPAELSSWGAFGSDAARCQRVVSRATSVCIAQVAQARARCLGGALGGNACDTTALTATVTAARQRALNRLERSCTEPELQNLGYLDRQDAQKDVTDACRQLDTAATTAAFGPAMVGGTVAAVDATKAACVRAAARESNRLMRYAMRAYQQALDRIAGTPLTPNQKMRLVEWARARVARAERRSAGALAEVCPVATFANYYGRSSEQFLARIAAQAGCLGGFIYVQDEVVCPAPECGNGMQELGEECDDGNDFDGDGCRADCIKTECEVFANTYDLIQQAIFDNHGCSIDACHGIAESGGLDLRAGRSYENLIDVPSSIDPSRMRIEPGDPQLSLLFLKVASKTLPSQYPFDQLGTGTPMPPIGTALSENELEAVRRWIYGAATQTGSIPGVGELLDACLPEPEPLEIKPLEKPPYGEGVQLQMPQWVVPAKSEDEVCFASYYDVTDEVPEAIRGPNDTFCYNTEQLRQDPLSHHLIVNQYIGQYGPEHPAWGLWECDGGSRDGLSCDPNRAGTCGAGGSCIYRGWECAGGPRTGESCDPTVAGACGTGGTCITPIRSSVACAGFGPDTGRANVQFAGAQETNATSKFPAGAYRCVPLKGMIWWNSHAFNLTNKDGLLRAWINFGFAPTDQRLYYANGIFNLAAIFAMNVPAFQQQEICSIQRMPPNAHLFELTSHMHQRGKRWRTFLGEFTCQGERRNGEPIACDPLSPTQCSAGVSCAAPDGRNPMDSLIYTNFLYNDPVQLRFDPPLIFTGNQARRSMTYCALYDNGFTDPTKVKRQSTSPQTPFGTSTCGTPTHCYAGKVGAACSGANPEARHRSCDSSAGAGDGLCDACTLMGGVTTEDEMFLLLGSYYVKN